MVLFYFDIFQYPLTAQEIVQFCHHRVDDSNEVMKTLEELVAQGHLFLNQGYYQLQDRYDHIRQREENNARAERYLDKARHMSRLIACFPFTRAVFVSGSLSKNVMPPGGDIDYFIVTQPGRLWLSRTLLVLFKKIFLLNSHKYFCVNYFVDEDHLEIEEKNIFTATEIVTLLPMRNEGLYQQFMGANAWARGYYPNFPGKGMDTPQDGNPFWFKSVMEWCLDGFLGEKLDTLFMRQTLRYWNKKFKSLDPEQFTIALKSRRYVSKHHPQGFQQRVLDAFREKIGAFEQRHGLTFEFHENML